MTEQKHVTCVSVGIYEHVLSKGSVYEVVGIKNENYRIQGNHGRLVYISKTHFVEGSVEIPILASWQFDDNINEVNFIEVTFTFNDGSRRWAFVTTPEKLQSHFEGNVYPPGLNMNHLIIIRTLNDDDVQTTFRTFDKQGQL
jgi:hypothetical protein